MAITIGYLPQAIEFARLPVTVLVAVGGDMTARAALAATSTIPIVAVFIGDPVSNGFIASLSRPGGNVAGVSNLNAVIETKRLGPDHKGRKASRSPGRSAY